MTQEERAFLKNFFRAVMDKPIEFDGDEAQNYVPLYDDPAFAEHDPVELLATPIEYSPVQSVQLLSGFRGSGKSTELRRLQRRLEKGAYKVVLVDIEDYLTLSQPVDVSDFLIALMGGFGDALLAKGYLEGDPAKESYWERFAHFVTQTRIEIPDASAANVKLTLKNDPSFRQKLQERMAGHIGALVEHVRSYIESCVKKLKDRYGHNTEVVLLVDSMEHIRGTLTNAEGVQNAVVNLFARHSEKLHFDYLHVIYTIPPYLKVLHPNLGALYAPGGVQMLPTLKVHEKRERKPFQPALDLMERLIAKRGDWRKLLGGERATLDALILLSGGHLRDFLRLFSEILRRAKQVPVPRATVDAAIAQVRSEFLPIANADATWLNLIATTQETELPEMARLHDLARYLDTHLALCYRNGSEWYDVHPLVRDVVQDQAAALKKRGEDISK